MQYRLLKAANTLAYIALILLTAAFIGGELHWRLAIGALVISGVWLIVTGARMGHLLKTYFDVLSRLEVLLPALLGIGLALFALFRAHLPHLKALAAFELAAWALLLVRYRLNRRQYVRQGHGPMPARCWVSPPAAHLQAGDLLLTSGRVAAGLRESVGHSELVLRTHDGEMVSFSSYMGRGTVLHELDEYLSHLQPHGHYIALRLADALTNDQLDRTIEIAHEMVEENRRWRAETNARRRRFVDRLPLPRRGRERLYRLIRSDGYDWFGLFMGRIANHRWTCIGSCLELYDRVGVRTRPWGTGLLGFGTSVLDPIMPVRLLDDPTFRPLEQPQDPKAG